LAKAQEKDQSCKKIWTGVVHRTQQLKSGDFTIYQWGKEKKNVG
jgi:hypothetical protein